MTRRMLSILVVTLKSRRTLREALLRSLAQQAARFSDVEVCTEEDAGELPSGAKRNRLIHRCRGKYFAFVDDDDMVAPDYVASLHGRCTRGPDVVTFRLLRRAGGGKEVQSLSIYNCDHRPLPDGTAGMHANHLCAWKRTLGNRLCFPPILGYNDDVFWYKGLLATGLVKSEIHVPRVLYEYRYDPRLTVNQQAPTVAATHQWAGPGIEYFRRGRRYYIAREHKGRTANLTRVPVWDRHGNERMLPRRKLALFTTVRAQ